MTDQERATKSIDDLKTALIEAFSVDRFTAWLSGAAWRRWTLCTVWVAIMLTILAFDLFA